MNKAKLTLLLGGSLVSGLAMAAPPQFGEWSAERTGNTTNIDACSGRTNIVSCQVLVEDTGFIQVQVKDTDGNNYIQSIIADGLADGATGDDTSTPFWDENYIRIKFQAQLSTLPNFTSGDPGFMGKQAILDAEVSSGNTWFEATTTIATGWGLDILYAGAQSQGAQVAVDLTTDFWTTTGGVIDPATGKGEYNGMFDTRFYYQAYNDASGAIIGRIIDIDQDLSLQTVNPQFGPGTNIDDRQYFLYMDRSGVLLENLGSGVWGSSTDTAGLGIDDPFTGPNVGSDGAIEWGDGAPTSSDPSVLGEQIIAFYIGQEVSTAGFGNEGKSTFYHLQVDETGSYDAVYEYSQAGSGFEDPSIFQTDPVTGDTYTALGGYSDWFNGAESTVFEPKWGARTGLNVLPDATGIDPIPGRTIWMP